MSHFDGVAITHHFGDREYAKEICIAAGMFVGQHSHPYMHLGILAKGMAIVEVEGHEVAWHAPACIEIAAGKEHSIKAITDVVWYCVHGTLEKDPAKVDAAILAGD